MRPQATTAGGSAARRSRTPLARPRPRPVHLLAVLLLGLVLTTGMAVLAVGTAGTSPGTRAGCARTQPVPVPAVPEADTVPDPGPAHRDTVPDPAGHARPGPGADPARRHPVPGPLGRIG
jgi:hypothetical protein